MSATRTYQCPGCGELIPTKRDPKKLLTCPKCKTRGLISKHSVATPMTVARKKKAQERATATREARQDKAPFTKDQLLGRIEMPEKIEKPEETPDQDEYKCEECNASLRKGQKHCENCGAQLDWSG